MLVGLQDIDLDECSSQLLFFPGRRRLAGAKAHDYVLPASRLARVKRDILDDAVSLVEDPEHCDALCHGRYTALPVRRRGDLGSGCWPILLLVTLAARAEHQRDEQR